MEIFCFHPIGIVLHPTGYPGGVLGEKEPVLQSYVCTMSGVLGSWETPQHHGHESNGKMRLGVSDAERGVVCLSQTGFV